MNPILHVKGKGNKSLRANAKPCINCSLCSASCRSQVKQLPPPYGQSVSAIEHETASAAVDKIAKTIDIGIDVSFLDMN